MPIYEYECSGCHRVTEAMQKFSDAPLEVCETCGGKLTKLVSRTSFQLKGSGWYATDYKKGGASPAAEKKDSSETPASPAKESTPKPSSGGDKT